MELCCLLSVVTDHLLSLECRQDGVRSSVRWWLLILSLCGRYSNVPVTALCLATCRLDFRHRRVGNLRYYHAPRRCLSGDLVPREVQPRCEE
jgi:hypothetical protein